VTYVILGLYEVTQGEIFLDGINIRCFNKEWLRSQLGIAFFFSFNPNLFTNCKIIVFSQL
jgi:ABC-type multidrug transport system fused ATPase/permease subunit